MRYDHDRACLAAGLQREAPNRGVKVTEEVAEEIFWKQIMIKTRSKDSKSASGARSST